MIKCIVVDDEPLAREGLGNYVKEVGFLELVGTCENPVELTNLLNVQSTDLIFLDIQMPKMNGIDFLKTIQRPPLVILTTAFPTYALDGFQLNALDYLLKPITFDRFLKSANKAKDYFDLVEKANNGNTARDDKDADHFFVKCGSKFEKIFFNDILYAESMQNYVTIYTKNGKYMPLLYLKNLEQNLDTKSFIRVHKSYIVSINKIDGIEGNEIFIGVHKIPISRNYREQVIQQVVMNKLWDKIRFS